MATSHNVRCSRLIVFRRPFTWSWETVSATGFNISSASTVPFTPHPFIRTLTMAPITLRTNPTPDDEKWEFNNVAIPGSRTRPGIIMGKHISFSPSQIKLDIIQFPSNRILHSDDPSKFVLCSFELLRFPDKPASIAKEYMLRFFQSGLFLNGVQYRFYGHSNSQLVRAISSHRISVFVI